MNKKSKLLIGFLLALTPALHAADWRQTLKKELPLLGHRNWIVIADSAYPWQTALGVETVETGKGQIEVTRVVLDALSKTKHVRPVIMTDSELPYVSEKNAPGITTCRSALAELLRGRTIQSLPHEQIIKKLDEAGKTFHVLLLKTNHTQPYTSVFLQLECGYWSPKAEKELRSAMTCRK
jgi:D-ribose pyranose/furanose isomerase RbsD